MSHKRLRPLVGIFLILSLVSCGGRLPSPKTSQHIIQKHFEKYGKKYKESEFGRHKLTAVEISSVEELQKGLASVDAYVTLQDGPVYKVRVTLRKKSFGWKYQSWETLAGQ